MKKYSLYEGFELISLRKYAYEQGITKPGAIRQIKEDRLPEFYEARMVDDAWVIIRPKSSTP